jgi:hypothetical protein
VGAPARTRSRLLHRFRVVGLSRAHSQLLTERLGIRVADVGDDVDRAELVLLTFLEGERQRESLRIRIHVDGRRKNPEIRVTVLQIEAPQQLLVGRDAFRIVDVTIAEPAQPIAADRSDDVEQLVVGESLVADEVDLPDGGLLFLGDLEDEIDTIIGLVDDLRIDPHVEVALPAVNFDDTLDIGLHHRT